MRCKNCGEEIFEQNDKWYHLVNGHVYCMNQKAEPEQQDRDNLRLKAEVERLKDALKTIRTWSAVPSGAYIYDMKCITKKVDDTLA